MWLWPYGYDYNALPDNWQEIKKLAEDAADALYQVHGTVFDPINSADLCKLFTVSVPLQAKACIFLPHFSLRFKIKSS